MTMTTLFLGSVVMTRGVAAWSARHFLAVSDEIFACLNRHREGDWGDIDSEDKEANDFAAKGDGRILSSYTIDAPDGVSTKIWIITEWDRSYTTVLFPDEY